MKKTILSISIIAMLGLASSCQKCNTCTGTDINGLNHDYCNDIYRTNKAMEAAQETCEARGGTWSEK